VVASVLLVAAFASTTGRAAADEEIPMAQTWGGSNVLTPAPVTAPTTELHIEGRVQRGSGRPDSTAYTRPNVAITLASPDDPAPNAGCDASASGPATAAVVGNPTFGGTVTTAWKRYPYSADVPFEPDRNGAASIYVCINGVYDGLDTQVLIRLPAPTVTNLVATAAGHAVNLTWDDMRGSARDLSGYRIERSLDGSTFTALQTVGPEVASFSDTTLPASGGEATYRVVALRPFVADASPSDSSAATFAATPGDGTGGTSGTGTGGTGSTSGGGTGGTGSGRTGRTVGRTGASGASGGASIRVPRVGTPSRNFFPALLAPPAVDTGFNEELPFDIPEPGEEQALSDELAADDSEAALPGSGFAIPVAIGLVLAVWAMHLRFLARAGEPDRPQPIEVFID